jgi:hypothetical protein
MTDFTHVALVSPQNAIDRVSLARLIDLDAGTKPGWRWLPIIEEYGEPFGDTVEADRVLRLTQDPALLPQPTRQVSKALIERRVDRHPGKLTQIMAMLLQDGSKFARWYSRDYPTVNSDDPDTIAALRLADLDPDEILAPGDD